jgi:hypothetical protein
MFIKPFAFTDFFDKGWAKWKFLALHDANRNVLKKHENLLHEMAAYARNVSKTPILYDKDDWSYLAHFPVAYWETALKHRYNEGLLKASETREAHPDREDKEKMYDMLSDVSPEMTLTTKGKKGKSHTFRNVRHGIKSLMQ